MTGSRTVTDGLSLGAPIDAALATLGGRPVDAVEVGGWRSGRVTYRVTLADGQILKVRQLRARNRVTRATALVAAVGDPRLPPALAVVGAVTVEAWVDGTVLSSRRPTGREIDAAADLLTDLHALQEIEGHRFRKQQPTAAVLTNTKHQVEDLTAAGLLARHDASRLVARVAGGLPTSAPRWGHPRRPPRREPRRHPVRRARLDRQRGRAPRLPRVRPRTHLGSLADVAIGLGAVPTALRGESSARRRRARRPGLVRHRRGQGRAPMAPRQTPQHRRSTTGAGSRHRRVPVIPRCAPGGGRRRREASPGARRGSGTGGRPGRTAARVASCNSR